MTKEDKAFKQWCAGLPLYIIRDFPPAELRTWFDPAYNLGWQDCYDELGGKIKKLPKDGLTEEDWAL